MDKIRVLQLGDEDWSGIYTLPETVEWEYAESFVKEAEKPYDLVFLDRTPQREEIGPLSAAVKAHTLFVTGKVKKAGRVKRLCDSKKAAVLREEEIQRFLTLEAKYYFPKSYGEKFKQAHLAIARGFSGSVQWNGNYSVSLQGEFGECWRQAVFWRHNLPLEPGRVIDLWLEYQKDPEVSVKLVVTLFVRGSVSEVIRQWEFGEEDLKQVVQIDGGSQGGYAFVSLHAKGTGSLQVIALHDRHSRGSHGYFLPGGERFAASNREELFCYFDPGDRKPPLNVYFSGYKMAQGFEGYYLMKNLGCPFLLVAEPRLEGGGFYMGSKEYETLIADSIRAYMSELGFSADQVILSGLSMGTYGALYYGCDILPHAIILGKPLASIGNVAANEKYLRPGGFPTSLDVLMYLCGSTDEAAVKRLNDRFWNKFDAVDWGSSKFIISYMMEDDYDMDAYSDLISHLQSDGVQVYGKGIHGRHNDNTGGIVNWFVGQFERVLKEDFNRRAGT